MDREIERIIIEMRPVIDNVLSRYTRSGTLLTREDAEDVVANVHLRLVLKLRELAAAPDADAIRDLRGYVATLSYNCVSDHMRKRFPERSRLKSRLRYALLHDPRIALWSGAQGAVCGLAAWRGHEVDVADVARPAIAAIASIDRQDVTGALLAVFSVTGGPVPFDAAVDALAEGWNVVEPQASLLDRIAAPSREEDLEFMRALWSEIEQLPPMQRKALLLNLRYDGETNIVSMLVLTRVARFEEVAKALEMSPPELVSIWKSLPMEDSKIAERFGVSRQRVINLRKSARERLWRRLRR